MKVSKPIVLYLPYQLKIELEQYLSAKPPDFKHDSLYFYYFMDYLLKAQYLFKKEQDFIAINTRMVRAEIVANIDKYIKYLKNGEFIISDETFIAGSKSKGYSINSKYGLTDFASIEIQPHTKLYNKITKIINLKKSHYNRLEPFLLTMLKHYKAIEIDYPQAVKWIENEAQKENRLIYFMMLNNFNDKRFRYFKRNKTNNRLDTNLTNLKSELRQFIKGDYVSIDLKNSQPFFLSMLLQSIVQDNSINRCCLLDNFTLIKTFGIKAFKSISKVRHFEENAFLANLSMYSVEVLNGTLYDNIIEKYKGEALTRKQIKDIMFKVLFSSNNCIINGRLFYPYKKEKEIFASVYPSVYEIIEILKANNNSLLPIYLQRLESYIFIDCIAKKLVENNIIPLTIHDSVIVQIAKTNETLEIMNDVFNENFGCVPMFHVTPL
jgi:hypothetical protein